MLCTEHARLHPVYLALDPLGITVLALAEEGLRQINRSRQCEWMLHSERADLVSMQLSQQPFCLGIFAMVPATFIRTRTSFAPSSSTKPHDERLEQHAHVWCQKVLL